MIRSTYIEGGKTLKLIEFLCTGCGMCTIVCPHRVFVIKSRKAVIENKMLCMECGACQKNCPENAISVKAGVGCAAGIISGYINKTEPTCCSNNTNCC